jgi:hypothetical protein
MLNQSLQTCGIGRGIVVDKNLKIIGGNKTHEAAGGLGLENVIFVPTDGTELVVTVRTDLNLDAEPGSEEYVKARTLATADNRASEENLAWSAVALDNYAAGGVDLDNWFRPVELDDIFKPAPMPDAAGQDASDRTGPQEDGERSREAPKGTLIPLAISLTSAQYKLWKAFKEKQKLKKDDAAFLKLLEMAD